MTFLSVNNFDKGRDETGAVCVGTGKMRPGGVIKVIKPSKAQPCKCGFVSRTKRGSWRKMGNMLDL